MISEQVTAERHLTPVPVGGIASATALTAGGRHTCAILADGSMRCWGDNFFGQLGDGTGNNYRPSPVQTRDIANATHASGGGSHTCAVLADGTARCWGYDPHGELGDGTRSQRGIPAPVTAILGATTIAAGGSHSCAIVAGGAMRCWGSNGAGQAGDGAGWIPVAVLW